MTDRQPVEPGEPIGYYLGDDECFIPTERPQWTVAPGQIIAHGRHWRPGDARPWRVGRSLGRTVYAINPGDDRKADTLLGIMETPELAEHVVDLHNHPSTP